MNNIPQLDALAAKLNVTVAHLWGVLVAQAKIEAVIAAGRAVLGALMLALMAYFLRWIRRRPTADAPTRWATLWTNAINDYNPFPLIGVVMFLGIVAGIAAANLTAVVDAVRWWINPEFFALSKVLEVLR